MFRTAFKFLICMSLAGAMAAAQTRGNSASPRIAFTFDDLPAHSALPAGETRLDVAKRIISALRAAGSPPVYGFVNGVRVEEQPGDEAVLQAWVSAGNPLGNHGWSHMNLDQNDVSKFEDDITRNEPLLRKWMDNKDWHWFRFPFLAEGGTPEKQAAIRKFLAAHGYRVAGVTMSFGDYQWNEPYARCRGKGDAAAITSLKQSYLAAAEDSIVFYRQLSKTLYGRDIAYVLLMHIGAFDAEMLPDLLNLYRAEGFEFVTLPEAEKDGFYKNDIDLQLPYGPDMLERAMAERHLPFPKHGSFAPAADLCR